MRCYRINQRVGVGARHVLARMLCRCVPGRTFVVAKKARRARLELATCKTLGKRRAYRSLLELIALRLAQIGRRPIASRN